MPNRYAQINPDTTIPHQVIAIHEYRDAPSPLPAFLVEISSEVTEDHHYNPETGTFYLPPKAALTVEQYAAYYLSVVKSASHEMIAEFTADYSAIEIQTWEKQETEARSFIADPASDTPLLSALAATRDITVADLASRVITKADAFTAVIGTILGSVRAHKDRVAEILADPSLTDSVKTSEMEWETAKFVPQNQWRKP